MQTIHKYPLALADYQTLLTNGDAMILDVQVQHGELCLWAEADLGNDCVEYEIYMFGTGMPMPSELPYPHIATVQLNCFFWHIYGGEKA